jgi:undecaprenyl-diphosphatase
LAAGFVALAPVVESAAYRATTHVVDRQRPDVVRLDDLAADHSYPSGHTAAAVAVYCGLAFLVTRRASTGRARVACWAAATVLVALVAGARMYRGMHHPIDVVAGALLGAGALVVMVTAARCGGTGAARGTGRCR